MKPPYEQIEKELQASKQELQAAKQELHDTKQELQRANDEIEKLKALLKVAFDRIAELEKQIGRNSKNSSKPPSTDQKGNTSENKQKQNRQAHAGKARALYPSERVNHHVQCTRETCPYCNSEQLHQLQEVPAVWQQVELPEVQAVVTQFNCQKYCCEECGQNSVGELPEGVPYSAFGPKLMALIATLTGRFHLAKRETMQLLSDLYGIELSVGSIINIEENVANALDEIYEKIHRCVVEGTLPRYFDETSWRDSGKRHYVWTATTKLAAYYKIDPRRSQEAFFKVIGTHTSQPSVSDRYNAYNALDGPHQYCLAHLIRDFHAFAEEPGENGQIGGKIEQELRKACGIHAEWRDGKLSKKQMKQCLAHSKRRLDNLFTDAIAFASEALATLCERLGEEYERLWAFTLVDGMEPTNNLAERDLRKLVLWRKKSYGTRSPRGQRFVERITSVVETLKKNTTNVLYFLEEAVRAFYKGSPSPSIAYKMGI